MSSIKVHRTTVRTKFQKNLLFNLILSLLSTDRLDKINHMNKVSFLAYFLNCNQYSWVQALVPVWMVIFSSVFLFCQFQILTVGLICKYRILNQIVQGRTTASRSSKVVAWLTKGHLRPQSLGLLTKFKTQCKIMSFRHPRNPL